MAWNCAACAHQEEAPTDPGRRAARAAKWTKVNLSTYLCPACTKEVNRDCDKEMRHLGGQTDARERERLLYETWWKELLAAHHA